MVLDKSNYLKIFCNYISKESNRLTFFQDLHTAMMILGVNIMEQECIDMTNEVAKNGHIYFPEFCRIVLRKFREDDDEQFAQVMFKVRSLFSKSSFFHQTKSSSDALWHRTLPRAFPCQEIQNQPKVSFQGIHLSIKTDQTSHTIINSQNSGGLPLHHAQPACGRGR